MSDHSDWITEAQVRRDMLRTEERKSRRRFRIGAVLLLAAALALGALALKYCFTLMQIRGDGMGRTLKSGDLALCVYGDAPQLGEPVGRGDLALVRYSQNGLHWQTVRRVIAVGGDVVAVDRDGHVTVNDAPLEEPYAVYRTEDSWGAEVRPGGALENPFSDAPVVYTEQADPDRVGVDDLEYPLTVPEGRLFVLCDNRENLLDSRSSRFGLPATTDVIGKARAIVWPVHRARLLADERAAY